MKQILNHFRSQILRLMDMAHRGQPNLVIGGSHALKAHGLNISWEPADLDIILFDPTPAQVLEVVDKYDQCLSYEAEEKGVIPRSFELSVGDKSLNVILAYDDPMPDGLLYVDAGGTFIPVNSIDAIVAAKLSYSAGTDKKYLRRKDMEHLVSLKNLNFNV